ncbi:hypothetical protein H0H87_003025, partial [Tephrocybe sp. NHM501043]
FKDRNVRGQHASTRAWKAIQTIQHKIDTSVNEYRAAQKAIISLGNLLGKVGLGHKLTTRAFGTGFAHSPMPPALCL